MNIGILTYHACLNYGACLQAYALQQTILKFGCNCKIIDYQSHKFISINRPFCKVPTHPKELIKNITRLPYFSQLKKREKLFLDFINNIQIISSRCMTEEDVQNECEKYDCIVCGSDQTWNLDPSIRYQTPLYYLNFAKKQRRVAYATSFGSWLNHFHEAESELLPWIQQFDRLSMREKSGVDLLRSKGLSCEWVLDPTFLLKRTDYEKIARERLIVEPYILLFSWTGSKESKDMALQLSNRLGYKVFDIVPPPRNMMSGIKRKLDVGPQEFLALVRDAECVVTDSFHGTVFSVIYQKPFVSVIKDKADVRRLSLMKQFGLEKHLMSPKNIDMDAIYSTDYNQVEKNLDILRGHSLTYLAEAVTK